ncbi:MAG: OmpH family outer membrane protein [Candidatus Acidiferrales bacterium]
MKVRYSLVTVFAVLLAIPAAWSQTGASADAPAEKVAVISLQEAIAGTAEGKQVSQQLTAQFAPRVTELQNIQRQLQDIQQRLQAGANTLSAEESARLERQGAELQRKGQREQQDLTDDRNDASQDAINHIGQKMIPILNKYAQENGYGVVIDTDTSAQNAPVVVYNSAQIDITKQIIKLYDDANPVKAATPPAAHPGTPKSPQKK